MKGQIIVVYNPTNTLAGELYSEMTEWLESRDYRVTGCDSHKCSELKQPHQAEFAISLGGDGTFLSCARLLAGRPVPILPVHLGTFGFITEVTHSEWQDALQAWLEGRLEVEDRLILDVKVIRGGKEAAAYKGVNDGVVSASGISKLVRLSMEIGGYEAGRFRGDGMILSTPTGSTAYSMAAGGPILVPPMPAMVLTPISPFSLSWRPTVLPGNSEVVIVVEDHQRADIQLTVDGQEAMDLEEGDRVVMSGLEGGARVIKSDKRGFYEVVRTKLGWSGGPHA